MIKKNLRNIDKKYPLLKSVSSLHPRYFEVFEFRHGLADGKVHSLKECGKHFRVSATRIGQIEARVMYELEQSGEGKAVSQ